jgi:hypothetical protein
MAEYPDLSGLEKDPAVLDLLSRLAQRLGHGAFQVVDHWEADLNAVGIAHPNNREQLAYIAVRGPDDLYVELELPPTRGSELPYAVAGEFRSLSFDQAAQIVSRHLGCTE